MSQPVERSVLTFHLNGFRYNYRTAGIAIREGHVLVCREDDDDYVMLPGGRVEIGEPSNVALERELGEELDSPAVIGKLRFTVENFFAREGEQFHELAAYYSVTLSEDFPFTTDGKPCLVRMDEGHELSFYWVPVVKSALSDINLLPIWIRQWMANLPPAVEHLIVDERGHG